MNTRRLTYLLMILAFALVATQPVAAAEPYSGHHITVWEIQQWVDNDHEMFSFAFVLGIENAIRRAKPEYAICPYQTKQLADHLARLVRTNDSRQYMAAGVHIYALVDLRCNAFLITYMKERR